MKKRDIAVTAKNVFFVTKKEGEMKVYLKKVLLSIICIVLLLGNQSIIFAADVIANDIRDAIIADDEANATAVIDSEEVIINDVAEEDFKK